MTPEKEDEMIKKYKKFIIRTIIFSLSLSIFASAGVYVLLSKKQTYKAEANIKFINAAAVNGYAYDGTPVKEMIKEITKTEVLNKAIKDEYMQNEITSNSVAKNIKIEEVIPQNEQDKIDSALKNGKEYIYNPIEFKIIIESDLPQSGKLLNSVIKNFIDYYNDNYVNPDTFPSNISLLLEGNNNDYIEQANMIRANLEAIEAFLENKGNLYPDYHNALNGYSFLDLKAKYEYIYNTKLPELYAKILSNKISKDPELLLQKLNQKNNELKAQSFDTNEELEKLESMIKSYSEKNKSNGTITNGKFGDSYDENHTSIIEGVYENNHNPESSYDELFSTYIFEKDLISANTINVSYNDYLISIFKEANTIENTELENQIKELINEILFSMDRLYVYASTARNEHLDIESTSMIVQLNTPISVRQLNVKMYTLLAIVGSFTFTVVAIPVGAIFINNLVSFLEKRKEIFDEKERIN